MIDQPFTLPSGLKLENRLAKAALTESQAGPDGAPNEALLRYSRTMAEGGAGLNITGNVMVDGRYLERSGNVVLEDESQLEAFRAWARAIGARGTPALVQLSHPGRQTNRLHSGRPVAPSAVPAVDVLGFFAAPRALEVAEIREIIGRFVRAAQLVEQAGFAGVQVHSAHGYLLSQFLSPLTNQRRDEWGGSLENRARALREIVRAIRASTARGFTLAVKLNSADFQRGGFEENDALEVVRWLADDGIDLIEISGGNYESPALLGVGVAASTVAREAYFLEFARKVRTVSRVPLMVTGGFRSREAMDSALSEGALDLIGLGRPLLLEPDLPKRLLSGQTARAITAPKRIGSGAFSSFAEACYYDLQIARLARGLVPRYELSPYAGIRSFFARELRRLFGRWLHGSSRRALPVSSATSGS